MKRLFHTILSRFRDLKLWKKFSIAYLVMFLLPALVLALFLSNSLYDVILSNTVESEFTLTRQRAGTLSATLDNVTYTANTILSHRFFAQQFSGSDSDRAAFLEALDSMVDGELITAIRIYVEPEYLPQGFPTENTVLSASDIYGTYWYGMFSAGTQDHLLCPTISLSAREEADCGPLAYIARVRTSPAKSGRTWAYVAVYFSQARIDSILQDGLTVPGSAVYLLDSRDGIVATTDAALSGLYYLPREQLTQMVDLPGEYISTTFLGERCYLSYYPVSGTDWSMVAVYPYSNLLQVGHRIVLRFLIIYLLFSLLAFLLTIVITRSIIRRVSAVSRQMQQVQQGRVQPLSIPEPARDEIGTLAESYNYMCGALNALMEQRMKAADQLRLTEFKALQSQINPHFLYNTLDAINWQALEGDTDMVVKTVRALSDFYRLTLSKGDTFTVLAKELEHITLYLSLLNIRFGNSIQFVVDVPDSLLDCEIPKMTLQPLVENAALHGISEREGRRGSIAVTGWLEGDDLVLLISDDGVGMDEDTLAHLMRPAPDSAAQSGIGVYNTDQRLKLYYGAQYGLQFQSTPDVGTDVTLHIPYHPHENKTNAN